MVSGTPSAPLSPMVSSLGVCTGSSLAIDLGNSTTVVAYLPRPDAEVELLRVDPYSLPTAALIPSLLFRGETASDRPLLGQQVLEAGLRRQGGPRLRARFKRSIGRRPLDATVRQAQADGASLLRALWQALPLEGAPERLVLTAPVEAFDGYRQWLLDQADGFAVPELALVDEPTAAAIGSGLPPGSRVLVVDLGGGTSDLSLVQLQGGEGQAAPIAQLLRFAQRNLDESGQRLRCARVIGKAGMDLGGADLDAWIAVSLAARFGPGLARSEGDGPLQVPESLLEAAEGLKCQLSLEPQAGVALEVEGERFSWSLGRSDFEALLQERGLLRSLEALLKRIASAARRDGLRLEQIDAVLPVGGTCQIPLVQQWLRERLPGVPLLGDRPVEAVAVGALALTPNVRVRDVLSRGVAMRFWDRRQHRYRWHPLFLAGQPWPTSDPLQLVLAAARNGQQALELVLAEPAAGVRREVVFIDGQPVLTERDAGEEAMDPWPQQPGPLPLSRPGRAGEDSLRLSFSIDDRRWLCLDVEDLGSGTTAPPRRLGSLR